MARDDELAHLYAFLDRFDGELRAVVLEGEAGIEKSTLWAAGVARAQERGFRVLASRPAEVERGLAHVVLTDLLEGSSRTCSRHCRLLDEARSKARC